MMHIAWLSLVVALGQIGLFVWFCETAPGPAQTEPSGLGALIVSGFIAVSFFSVIFSAFWFFDYWLLRAALT